MGRALRERIAAEVDAQKLGLEVVYVGVIQAHPENTVAKAFAEVVNARQLVIANIRAARVEENKILSAVAGDRERAADLADTLDRIADAERARTLAERVTGSNAAAGEALKRFDELKAPHSALVEAEAARESAAVTLKETRDEFELGLGQSKRAIAAAEEALKQAEAAAVAARQAYDAAAEPIRAALRESLGEEVAAAVVQEGEARLTLGYWNGQLETLLVGLEGAAAVRLAQAQALRWQREMKAAGEVAVLQNERYAYEAAPEIFRARRFLEVLRDGLGRARKYFVMVDDPERVKLRIEAQERARPDLATTPLGGGSPR
jgi:hypothetical protein